MSVTNQSIRLDKFLANRGVCARRDVAEFLQKEEVTLNGKRVIEAGTRFDPKKDDLKVSGSPLRPVQLVYYLLNKPKGVISTVSDEFDRSGVTSLIPTSARIYPVGRLDKDTTGLLILTNDGELTNLLTHPRYHIDKTYKLTIKGKISKKQHKAFENGVLLEDGLTSPAQVQIVFESDVQSIITLTIHEGKNRQIRRMCETLGINLIHLARISIGSITLGDMPEGSYRELDNKELSSLVALKHKRQGKYTDHDELAGDANGADDVELK